MNRSSILLTAALSLIMSALSAPAVAQVKYTVTSLSGPNGLQAFYPYGINDRCQVWGLITLSTDPTIIQHGVLWQNGVAQDLGPMEVPTGINDVGEMLAGTGELAANYVLSPGRKATIGTFPGGTVTNGTAINNLGIVVGQANLADGSWQAFWWLGGILHSLNIAAPFSTALAINDLGQITGMTSTMTASSSLNQVFIWENGQYRILPMPNGNYARPTGINLAGNVVGFYGESNGFLMHGFMYTNGQVIDIGSLGLGYSYAVGINNRNQVVGNATSDSAYAQVAILYEYGTLNNLNTLIPVCSGWNLVSANAINNLGQIVGYGNKGAFLLNPIR